MASRQAGLPSRAGLGRVAGHYLPDLVHGANDGIITTFAKALTAAKAMTSPAVTIAPYESAADAARLMCERGVNRLPVVKGEKLVGIVTRADLVRAFTRRDEEIEKEIEDEVHERTLWIDPAKVAVDVSHGTVRLDGRLHTRSDVELLERLVARVPGVVSVASSVVWQVDGPTRKGRRALEQPCR